MNICYITIKKRKIKKKKKKTLICNKTSIFLIFILKRKTNNTSINIYTKAYLRYLSLWKQYNRHYSYSLYILL